MKRLAFAWALALAACTPASPESVPGAAAERLRAPDVRYEPSPQPVVEAMLELAQVRTDDLVYDLGSGDGRIPITAARRYRARAVGIDIDPQRIAEARANARSAGVTDRVAFRNEDLFEAEIGDATVVTLFLSRRVNERLRPKLLAELKPGTRVVSYWHAMGDWPPERVVPTERAAIYLWRIPPRPDAAADQQRRS